MITITIKRVTRVVPKKSYVYTELGMRQLKTYTFYPKGGRISGIIPYINNKPGRNIGISYEVAATSFDEAKELVENEEYFNLKTKRGIYEENDNNDESYWNFFDDFDSESDLMKGGVMVEYE